MDLDPPSRRRGLDHRWVGDSLIDDYYAISVHSDGDASPSQAELAFRAAKAAYARAGIIGSDDKDVQGEDLAVCTGAEIDSSPATRSLGLALVGAPRQKRIAIAAISLEVARLPCTTDHLHLSLLGGWTSILLYKRPLMSIVSEAYHLVDATKVRPQAARTVPLPRAVANELALLSALCHVLVADVSSDWLPEIFATDSSEEKGAIVKADLDRDASKVLWGASLGPSSSARLLSKERAALMRVDRFFEELLEDHPKAAPKRPLALRLHFLEVCASRLASLSLSVSSAGRLVRFSRPSTRLSMILPKGEWVSYLVCSGLLDSLCLRPPRHPGARVTSSRKRKGTEVFCRCLALLRICITARVPCLLLCPASFDTSCLRPWEATARHPEVCESVVAWEEAPFKGKARTLSFGFVKGLPSPLFAKDSCWRPLSFFKLESARFCLWSGHCC